jgi:hypothetical protein
MKKRVVSSIQNNFAQMREILAPDVDRRVDTQEAYKAFVEGVNEYRSKIREILSRDEQTQPLTPGDVKGIKYYVILLEEVYKAFNKPQDNYGHFRSVVFKHASAAYDVELNKPNVFDGLIAKQEIWQALESYIV